MATSSTAVTITAGSQFKLQDPFATKCKSFGHSSRVTFQRKPNQLGRNRKLSVRAEYNDDSGSGSSDFIAGFFLGGAVFGTLAYIFAPQIRRSILNEDEYGFRRARRPMYYDDGLEKTRETLNAKISQLNSAIDNVSSRLRGGKKKGVPEELIEKAPSSEYEASL